jgi:hypothetical protein
MQREKTFTHKDTAACSFRWIIVAESTVRWFIVREKHCAGWLLIWLNQRNEQGDDKEKQPSS